MLYLQELIYLIQYNSAGELAVPAVIRSFNVKFPNTELPISTASRQMQKKIIRKKLDFFIH